ncbi:Os11g0517400 [Oryza sativa Japonica Group]|jgi:hypothetical protein|uniref:Expressed protein n=2 Tax=Oryza sativa subsp. japonica TaxID=39947 RepID=Q2R3J7_ORYSJ|nr:expressed protein [Oryza sativa Japonica Group]BAF28337.1 Os11g0517400 [Oryza sativa Japonica Group]|eukprot:NP_001067974.1 Os11g0517400 [Oryza sativa Japonica Group]
MFMMWRRHGKGSSKGEQKSLMQSKCLINTQFLQCVHALWNRDITYDLSKKFAKAKRLGIDEEEGFQEIEMRQWLQDIREIGKCIKLQQAHKGKICTWNWEFEDEFEDIFQFILR